MYSAGSEHLLFPAVRSGSVSDPCGASGVRIFVLPSGMPRRRSAFLLFYYILKVLKSLNSYHFLHLKCTNTHTQSIINSLPVTVQCGMRTIDVPYLSFCCVTDTMADRGT